MFHFFQSLYTCESNKTRKRIAAMVDRIFQLEFSGQGGNFPRSKSATWKSFIADRLHSYIYVCQREILLNRQICQSVKSDSDTKRTDSLFDGFVWSRLAASRHFSFRRTIPSVCRVPLSCNSKRPFCKTTANLGV